MGPEVSREIKRPNVIALRLSAPRHVNGQLLRLLIPSAGQSIIGNQAEFEVAFRRGFGPLRACLDVVDLGLVMLVYRPLPERQDRLVSSKAVRDNNQNRLVVSVLWPLQMC